MRTINKLVALAGMALLTGLATSCQNEDLAGADSGKPLPLSLSATLTSGQGSAVLTRAGEENTVAMSIPDGSKLSTSYFKTAEGIKGASRQSAIYTTTRQVDGNGAVSYSLALNDGYKNIIDYTRGKDYTLTSYSGNIFTISQPCTDGTAGNYDVPFYSVISNVEADPAITANSATGTATHTLRLKLQFAGMRFLFKLADDVKLAGYTAQFTDFTPMMGDISDPVFMADRRASLAATSCAVLGFVNPNNAVSGGATAGILTVKYTNAAEGTTEERKLRICLPSAGIATPEAGKLYTYNVTIDRKEALTAQTVGIATFITANGNGYGEDIIQGGDGKLHWMYDFAGMTSDQIDAQIIQIKNRMANIVIPGGTSNGAVALTLNNIERVPFTQKFTNNLQLESITLTDVTITDYLEFSKCTSLTSVSLPKATSIGHSTLSECTALTNVNLPVATDIGMFAFHGCTALTNVNLPVATYIRDNAFQNCYLLTSLNLPAATDIGLAAFASCKALTNLSLPAATNIQGSAFNYCTALTNVNLPVATTIGPYAFDSNALTTLSLPAATEISLSAFPRCKALTSLNLPVATNIGSHAFISCGLTEVNLPMAKTLGIETFSKCGELTSVNLPLVTSINKQVFSNCVKLTSLSMPALTNCDNAFIEYCNALTTLKLTASGELNFINNPFSSFSNSANCTLYLNVDKKPGGAGSPNVEDDGITWFGLKWKEIKYE